jgi:hypothetical protein
MKRKPTPRQKGESNLYDTDSHQQNCRRPDGGFEWSEDVLAAYEENQERKNYSITVNGITYKHIPDTEKFRIENIEQTFTALQVMKTLLPHTTRSLYKRILPPDKFFNFADSTRFKIIKAFQAHCYLPPVTEETKPFREFFEVLSSNVKGHWTVQQQYSAARFATQYKDDDSAASLLLHYGWSPKYKNMNMRGASMHKLTITGDGILIDMTYTHTFQERLETACSTARFAYDDIRRKGMKVDVEIILSNALKEFYLHDDKFISINNTYAQSVKTEIRHYIDSLINPMASKKLEYPKIKEPNDMLDDDVFLLRWDDFQYHDNADAKQQRRDNNKQAVLMALRLKVGHLPNGAIFKRSQLVPPLNDRNLKSGQEYDFIIKPIDERGKEKHGYYIINLPEEDEE